MAAFVQVQEDRTIATFGVTKDNALLLAQLLAQAQQMCLAQVLEVATPADAINGGGRRDVRAPAKPKKLAVPPKTPNGAQPATA